MGIVFAGSIRPFKRLGVAHVGEGKALDFGVAEGVAAVSGGGFVSGLDEQPARMESKERVVADKMDRPKRFMCVPPKRSRINRDAKCPMANESYESKLQRARR